MKKGFLACVILGLMMFAMGSGADLFEPRIAGTAGSFFTVVVDTSDTAADGTLALFDTLFSDTITIADSGYSFLTAYGKLVSFDTGSVLDDDSTADSITINMITTINDGTANWTVAIDTILAVGDSFRHHFVVDTMLYNQIFWRTIYIDTLNPSDNDTNTYFFDLDILGR